jgi:tight adherence protein B
LVEVTTVIVAIGGGVLSAALGRAAQRSKGGRWARDLGDRPRWRLPARPRARLGRALSDAAVDLDPEGACELVLGGVGASIMVALAIAPGLAVPAALVVMAAGPVALRIARNRAQQRFVAALPSGLEQVAAALRGGASIGDALESFAADSPLRPDVSRVRARAALGGGLADALAAWPEERPVPAVRATAGALAVAASIGGRSADALDGLAASLRDRLGAVAEAQSLSAQARLSAVVVGGAPIAYLVFSAIADPASVDALVGTRAGLACLVAGLTCEALAAIWMRRIVREGADE